MRVLKIEPNKFIKEIEIEKGFRSLQKEVCGYIEIPHISEELYKNNIDIVINEEGKLDGLEPTIAVIDKETNETLDLLVGNVLFTGFTEEGETIGLTDEQISIIRNTLRIAKTNIENLDIVHILSI